MEDEKPTWANFKAMHANGDWYENEPSRHHVGWKNTNNSITKYIKTEDKGWKESLCQI